MDTRDFKLWYHQSAQRWEEALPLGNGRLGAMIHGAVAQEVLQLNEDTLWSGRPKDWDNPAARAALPAIRALLESGDYDQANAACKALQGPYTQSYLPMGDLTFDFDEQAGAVGEYRRELDLNSAIATVRYKQGGALYAREAWISAPDQVLAVRLACSQPGGLSLRIGLRTALRALRLVATGAPDGATGILSLIGQAPSHVDPNYRASADPVQYDEPYDPARSMAFAMRLAVSADGGAIQADGDALRVAGANSVTVYLTAATSFVAFDQNPDARLRDPEALARETMQAVLTKPYARLRAAHIADHHALFNRVTLDLGRTDAASLPTDVRIQRANEQHDPQLAALLFQYGRYLLIASSRPGTQPANLQGIWNPHLRAPWSSNFTININTQMNYWPAEAANLGECHLPLLVLIAELQTPGAQHRPPELWLSRLGGASQH